VTDKHVYARSKDKKIFSEDLRYSLPFTLEKALIVCTYLVLGGDFKIQVIPNKKNEVGFEFLLAIVLSTTHLLRNIQGPANMRFIDALNELRKMPADKEKRQWADWIDFCLDENATVNFDLGE
jgi:hypothetical protein